MQTKDEEIIVDFITSKINVESIILTGSRAIGTMSSDSDFDILLVMSSMKTIFNLTKIKSVERDLSGIMNVPVSINPLPKFRIKRAFGNLFLFKVKHEGKILFGRNILPNINTGDISDIPDDKKISFLFSSIREISSISPVHFPEKWVDLNKYKIKSIQEKCLKNIAQYIEMTNGNYRTIKGKTLNQEDLFTITSLLESNNPPESIEMTQKNIPVTIDSLKTYWFTCQTLLIRCCSEHFCSLEQQNHSSSNHSRLIEEIHKYVIQNNFRVETLMKNLEYYLLNLLIKKSLIWRSLSYRESVQKRIRAAMLLNLMSSNENGTENKYNLNKSKLYALPYLPTLSSTSSTKEYLSSLSSQMILSETVLGI